MGLGTGTGEVYIPQDDGSYADAQKRAQEEAFAKARARSSSDAEAQQKVDQFNRYGGLNTSQDQYLNTGDPRAGDKAVEGSDPFAERGMNTFRASSLPLDDSRFGYGEHMSDAAKAWSQTYTERMQHADDRGMLAGPEAQAAYQQQMGARGMGMTGLGYMADVVSGRGPTQAEQMSARAAQRAQAQQMSMAASARGGGPAAALAQYQAQNAGSAAAADIAGQGMVQAGMERQQLAGALASGAAGMRGQDQAMMAMGLQNRAMNDQRYMGLMGAQQDVYKQQLLANIEHQRLQQQGHIAADTTNAKINEFNANQELNGGGLGGFVSDMGGGMLGGIF